MQEVHRSHRVIAPIKSLQHRGRAIIYSCIYLFIYLFLVNLHYAKWQAKEGRKKKKREKKAPSQANVWSFHQKWFSTVCRYRENFDMLNNPKDDLHRLEQKHLWPICPCPRIHTFVEPESFLFFSFFFFSWEQHRQTRTEYFRAQWYLWYIYNAVSDIPQKMIRGL